MDIRHLAAAVARMEDGRLTSVLALLDRNVRWYAPASGPLAGCHAGRGAVRRYLRELERRSEVTVRIGLDEVRPMYGALFVARLTVTACAGGRALAAASSLILECRNARIVRVLEAQPEQGAWDAFWSGEPAPAAVPRAVARAARSVFPSLVSVPAAS